MYGAKHIISDDFLKMNTAIPKPSFRVGLTGGVASGKSTVAAIFSSLGAHIIDADAIARGLTEKDHPNIALIIHHFGQSFLTSDGELNRKKLREHISQDNHANTWLKNLLHPQIHAAMMECSLKSKADYCMLMIPLLAQSTQNYQLDRICVVDCPETLQLSRLQARDNVSALEAINLTKLQTSREERLAIADDVILNDGDRASLTQQVQDLHLWYLTLSKEHSGNSSS